MCPSFFLSLENHSTLRKDWFGLSDPYLEIHRSTSLRQPCLVYRSPLIRNSLALTWPEIELSLATLCNGDRRRGLRFTVWDWNLGRRPDLIGSFSTSLERLEDGQLTYEAGGGK